MWYLRRDLFLLPFALWETQPTLRTEMQSSIGFSLVLKEQLQPILSCRVCSCLPPRLRLSSLSIRPPRLQPRGPGPFSGLGYVPFYLQMLVSFKSQGSLPVNINFPWICTLRTPRIAFVARITVATLHVPGWFLMNTLVSSTGLEALRRRDHAYHRIFLVPSKLAGAQ